MNAYFNTETIDAFMQKLSELAAVYGGRAIGALLILVIGFWLAGKLTQAIHRLMSKTHLEATFIGFASNVIKALGFGVAMLAALNTLGVPMTSVIALLGTAGLAVALALKDSLNNVAAGITLLILRPFKSGDYVEVGSVGGSVVEITFFHTYLNTPDNRRVVVPNAKVLSETITNYSENENRRVDMVVGVSYDSDIKKAREIMAEILQSDERVLAEPEMVIAVAELADSSVNFFVRPWVHRDNFWPLKFDFTERVKLAFDEAGIVIPFPQRDVHLHGEALAMQASTEKAGQA